MKPGTSLPAVTVAICTRNRAGHLRELCLESLRRQNARMENVEILVVDNGSGDDTQETVLSCRDSLPNLRYCREESRGLSHARNRAVREARGEGIAFLDDDAQASENWLAALHRFTAENPDVLVFGGPSDPIHRQKPPDWMPDGYGKVDLGDGARPLDMKHEGIIGCNMVLAKHVLEKIGLFDTSFGMKGEHPAWGEETQLCCRALALGLKVFYVPELRVRHLVQPGKYRLGWQLRAAFVQGRVNAVAHPGIDYGPPPVGVAAVGWVLLLFSLCGALVLRACGRLQPGRKQRLYTGACNYLFNLGRCFSYREKKERSSDPGRGEDG
jgi:glycosyltransferase involved in cell wall biosynthesis